MKTLKISRPWPIMVVAIMAVALGLPLLAYPSAVQRPHAASRIDCPEKARKKQRDWGWDVFNGRAKDRAIYRL